MQKIDNVIVSKFYNLNMGRWQMQMYFSQLKKQDKEINKNTQACTQREVKWNVIFLWFTANRWYML